MKRYLSLILSLVLAFSLTLTLTACSDDDETEDTDTTRVETSDTVLVPDKDVWADMTYSTTITEDEIAIEGYTFYITNYTTKFKARTPSIMSNASNPGDVTLYLYKGSDQEGVLDSVIAKCTVSPGETATFMAVGGYDQYYRIWGATETAGDYTFTVDW